METRQVSPSDTPRTDEDVVLMPVGVEGLECEFVHAERARQLERELAEVQVQLADALLDIAGEAPLPSLAAIERAADLLEQYASEKRAPCTDSVGGFGCDSCPANGGVEACLGEIEELEIAAKQLRSTFAVSPQVPPLMAVCNTHGYAGTAPCPGCTPPSHIDTPTTGRVHEGFDDLITDARGVKYKTTHVCRSHDGKILAFFCDADAMREYIALSAPSATGRKHWVFAAAEQHRPLVVRVKDQYGNGGRDHLNYMLDTIAAGMSDTKACRWLGWIQACVCWHGLATPEELKAINKAASDASADGTANR